MGGQYLLGTGDYHPHKVSDPSGNTPDPAGIFTKDLPWTEVKGEQGSDCAGFAICWCWKLQRHRPGFNVGYWATVSDDINVNSIMEDAEHHQELALCEVFQPKPGDLLCYPTFSVKGVDRPFIGHVGFIEAVGPGYKAGRYDLLTVIQCHGPNHFKPGVVRTDGSLFMHHDSVWPQVERQCRVVRMRERG